LLKQTEPDKDGVPHLYIVTIPRTKTKLFHLAICYVLCGTSFLMAANIVNYTYKVLSNPFLRFALVTTWATSSGLFVQLMYNVFLTFYDVCGLSHWHSISLPTKTHRILICVSVCTWKNITPSPTCMDALVMFQWHTSEVMFKMVSNFLTLLCHNWKLCLLGLSSHKVRNMTERVVNVVT
jgi:hypothetical protein